MFVFDSFSKKNLLKPLEHDHLYRQVSMFCGCNALPNPAKKWWTKWREMEEQRWKTKKYERRRKREKKTKEKKLQRKQREEWTKQMLNEKEKRTTVLSCRGIHVCVRLLACVSIWACVWRARLLVDHGIGNGNDKPRVKVVKEEICAPFHSFNLSFSFTQSLFTSIVDSLIVSGEI